MLIISLIVSGILLVMVNVSVWRSGQAIGPCVAWGVGCVVVPCFAMLVLPPVFGTLFMYQRDGAAGDP